ncbi:MAG: hypothetical protein IKE24_06140 [Clostridia bacterium]|nr:hypothetical protein [Clostridia bacterium]
MPLGWIDFSKNERDKVLSVLDLLSENGTLDELGIAPVRDGFAERFFPGTSTIQTRAKYFLIVPYILKDLEHNEETNPNRLQRMLDESEKKCAVRLLEKENDTAGVIGSRSLSQGSWVKRTPASIYWAGLRSYGIFTGGGVSLSEYLRAICSIKSQKANLKKLGNRNDKADGDENETDDSDAGGLFHKHFWSVPTYTPEWENQLTLQLTAEEGEYLKHQIIMNHPDTMLAYILKNNMTQVLAVENFRELRGLMPCFPEGIQQDYDLACAFSEFLFVLRILYNDILSNGENKRVLIEWNAVQDHLTEIASFNLEGIIDILFLRRNPGLCQFLRKTREAMRAEDAEELKTLIKKREKELKQGRAKTQHPGEFDPNAWYSGEHLGYRFNNAKTIIRDIFESEGKQRV